MAEYYHNSCSKCMPFAHTHARRHIRHCQLRCQRWSAKHAENAASDHKTGLEKTVCYLQRIFNRYRKLKQHGSK